MENRPYEDEISLKELILALLSGWKMIAGFTAIAVLLAALYVFVIATPTYESTIGGLISIPETTSTKYGTYTFPSTNKSDYLSIITGDEVLGKTIKALNLDTTIETLRKQVSVSTEDESSRFTISATAESPEAAQQLVLTISDIFVDEANISIKENAVNFFLRDYYVNQQSTQESLSKLYEQLNRLETDFADLSPVITLQKLITDDPTYAAQVAKDRGVAIEDLTDEMMLEEVVNENYVTVQSNIIDLKKSIQSLEVAYESNQKLYDELLVEEDAINDYYTNGSEEALNEGMLEVAKSRITLNSYATLPETRTSPKRAMTMAIALVLGGMLGVFAALFKSYWNNN